MLTLDMHPEVFINHEEMRALTYCRTVLKMRRWKDETMREFLSRPVHHTTIDACRNIRERVWHLCDDETKAAVIAYLEKANA